MCAMGRRRGESQGPQAFLCSLWFYSWVSVPSGFVAYSYFHGVPLLFGPGGRLGVGGKGPFLLLQLSGVGLKLG